MDLYTYLILICEINFCGEFCKKYRIHRKSLFHKLGLIFDPNNRHSALMNVLQLREFELFFFLKIQRVNTIVKYQCNTKTLKNNLYSQNVEGECKHSQFFREEIKLIGRLLATLND